MSPGVGRRVRVWLRSVLVGLAVAALCDEAAAEVKVTVNKRDHVVHGTTAAALVRSMNGNPVRGDHGNAYASIHPNYNLSVKTKERGGQCRAEVSIRLNFTLILPKAPARNLLDCPPDDLAHVAQVAQKIAKAAMTAFGADGITVQQFNEGAGGQVVFHLHVHVIPRKAGVTMKPPASEKEKPEVLAEQAKKLAAALASG